VGLFGEFRSVGIFSKFKMQESMSRNSAGESEKREKVINTLSFMPLLIIL
jgi:hypothetical protein